MYYQLIDKFKNNVILFMGVTLFAALVINFLTSIDLTYGIFSIAILIAILMVRAIFYNPVYAIALYWFISFILFYIFYKVLGITSVPLGFLLEGLNVLALLILLIKSKLSGAKTTIGTLLLIWLLLCFIELANPFAASRAAWFHAMRQVLNSIIPFFTIFSLLRMNQRDTLKLLLGTWLTFASLAAIYTVYQEFFGYASWDMAYLQSNENAMSLVFTFGRLRKMSFLSGPAENGVVLAFNAVICIGLAFQKGLKKRYKFTYLFLGIISAWGMIYSGTRTASVIFVIGVVVYLILSRNKELIIYAAVGFVMLMGYIAATGGGAALFVMTTAFNPDEDPSMQVRLNNQRILRTYLYKSPIGYGLGSTGYLGMMYSPNTFLGSFPPDSTYVRIVIESGWIGLAFWLFLLYKALSTSLDTLRYGGSDFSHNFRKVIIAVLMMLLIGQYPQEMLNVNTLKILLAFILAYVSLSKEELENSNP